MNEQKHTQYLNILFCQIEKKFYSRRARNELALVQDLRNISQISTLVSAKWRKQVRSVDEPTFS